jgi:hypothetical protein
MMNETILGKFILLFSMNYEIIIRDLQKKEGTTLFILQNCLIFGFLLLFTKNTMSDEILKPLNISKNIEILIFFVSGLTVAIGMQFFPYIIFKVISVVMNFKIASFSIWKISAYGTLPNIIGSIYNVLMIYIFGTNESGYTSLFTIFQPKNLLLSKIFQQINPFSILSYLLMAYLFSKLINTNEDNNLSFFNYLIALEVITYGLSLFG